METNFTKALFPAGITLTNRTRVSQFGEVSVLFLINIASVVGNTLLCISFFKNGHLRSVTNVFVLTLAVSDIVMSFTAMPLSEGALVAGEWIFGSTLCHIQGFLVHFLAFVSLQVMALTAINRYYRVTKPDLYKKIFTPGYTGIMIAAVSLFSFIILATITFGQHSNMFVFHPGKAICVSLYRSIRTSRIYTIFSCIAFVFLPAFIITYCYLKVFVAIRKHFRRPSVRSISSASFSSFNSAEIIVTRTVCVIVIAFFLCWIPCLVIDFVDIMRQGWFDRRVYLAYAYFAYTSSAINPFIYGVMNRSFRRQFSKMLKCHKQGKRTTKIEQNISGIMKLDQLQHHKKSRINIK